MMKRLIVLLVVVVTAAAAAAIARATPGQGQVTSVLSVGTLQTDLAFNTGITAGPHGRTWAGKHYHVNELPEFLKHLRNVGVTDLGAWLDLHPLVSAQFGLAPVALLHAPVIVTQQAKFAPGATSGWHSHPGYLTASVVSGQVVRYRANCSSETFGPGQSFYETEANTFVVRNESTADAVVMVTFVAPGGTPPTGLRLDQPQPTTCAK
jgi:quercetin dioxygenase-like cupin family protein